MLDPTIWGPKFWFFLHTITLSYPKYPNSITKKKYYELIQNFPLWIPVEEISKDFRVLLDTYPIQPYLDKKEDFIKWGWFIHNKINEKLEKPTIRYSEFYKIYYENYKPITTKINEQYQWKKHIYYLLLLVGLSGIIYYYYDK